MSPTLFRVLSVMNQRPCTVESFTQQLRKTFGSSSVHQVLADYEPISSSSEKTPPGFYIHSIIKDELKQ